jgi:RNA polymerase sigma-70 factor, ECF subfamily
VLLNDRPGTAAVVQRSSDHATVAALLAGDEATFLALVRCHHRAMIQLARLHVGSDALAEEVAQDAWIAVLRNLKQWAGRGSLRSWLFGIVANQARSQAARESRTLPLPDGELPDLEGGSCNPASGDLWSGDTFERREVLSTIFTTIERLPPWQRAVLTMRDVAGCDGPETCSALHLTEVNQRVLLHRARTKVRSAVEEYLRS